MNGVEQQARPRAAAFLSGVLLVLSACVVAFAFRTRECFVDDAFIGFQYLANLAAGAGFVFHLGDAPVEGVTNIGWLLLLAPFCSLAEATDVAKLAGLALVLFSLVLTACLGRRLAMKLGPAGDDLSLALVPCMMLATSFEFVYFPLAGMETGLLATVLLLMAVISLDRPCSLLLPVLGAFAFLVHPEAAAVYLLYAVLGRMGMNEDRSTAALGRDGSKTKPGAAVLHGEAPSMLVFLALLGGISAARFAYFGDIVPNTFHSKPSNVDLVIQNVRTFMTGQNTNMAFPITGWLALPVLLVGYLRLRRAAAAPANMVAAICATGLAFAVYSPTDWTALPRYFAPYLPAALILFWQGLREAVELLVGQSPQPRTRQIALAAIALLLFLTNIYDGQFKMAQMDGFPGYVLSGKNLVGPSKWINDHVPSTATIATRRIGVLAYYSGRRLFDYTYGLAEPEVARLVAIHGRRFDTPTEPALSKLWRDREPDYLLEDAAMMDYIVAHARGTSERFTIHGLTYSVVEQFPIGSDARWMLARRID